MLYADVLQQKWVGSPLYSGFTFQPKLLLVLETSSGA